MGWATSHIARLQAGEQVQFRPKGNSMAGRVDDGQLVTVVPIDLGSIIAVDDIVLCKVNGRQFLHLVKAIGQDGRYQIGNNRGHINGWCHPGSIYGRVVKVED